MYVMFCCVLFCYVILCYVMYVCMCIYIYMYIRSQMLTCILYVLFSLPEIIPEIMRVGDSELVLPLFLPRVPDILMTVDPFSVAVAWTKGPGSLTPKVGDVQTPPTGRCRRRTWM